jgi:hypothetical protein
MQTSPSASSYWMTTVYPHEIWAFFHSKHRPISNWRHFSRKKRVDCHPSNHLHYVSNVPNDSCFGNQGSRSNTKEGASPIAMTIIEAVFTPLMGDRLSVHKKHGAQHV